MFDPGALGTLIIGLRSVQDAELESTVPAAEAAPARKETPIRHRLASGLRSLAERLDAIPDIVQPAGDHSQPIR